MLLACMGIAGHIYYNRISFLCMENAFVVNVVTKLVELWPRMLNLLSTDSVVNQY